MNNEWGEFSLYVSPDSFLNLHQLEVLDLGYNKIESITEETICHLNSLKILNLTHNDLTSIIPDSNSTNKLQEFCAGDLSELEASHNKIELITRLDLKKFKNLRILRLAHNNIVHVDGDIFTNYEKIQIIDFSHNKLLNIPPT
ncbi:Leucine-rich repeat and fibronectin type-III domain-containing protein 2, partial [Stegodyphus mimosarum]